VQIMLRAVTSRAAQAQEAPALVRGYLSALKVDFASDISSGARAAKADQDILAEWNEVKGATEHTLQLLETYKAVGDAKSEPYLKYHNPRTFEDFTTPVPNFRTFGLKSGEVPKFFDNVLMRRAEESIQEKGKWWATRKSEVEAAASKIDTSAFPRVPVPIWQLGKPLSLEALNATTDALTKALEPKRKLRLPQLPADVTTSLTAYAKSISQPDAVASLQEVLLKSLAEKAVVEEGGKAVPGFQYTSSAEAAKELAAKRAEVNRRWVALWAKRLEVAPESALVPLNEIDSLIASNYSDFSTKYDEAVAAASNGTTPYGEKLAASAGTDTVLMRQEKSKVLEAFPTTPEEQAGIAVATELSDGQAALARLLGPTLAPEGTGALLRSEEVERITKHLFAPGRYFYEEGLKLAEKLREEEAALKAELAAVYGPDVDLRKFQASPRTAVQVLLDRLKQADAVKAAFAEERQAAGNNPFLLHAVAKREALAADPSNIAFEEVLYPEIVAELHAIELAELDEKLAAIEEAEEEEAFHLRLLQQAKHIHHNIDFDLPQGVVAHMDPILMKKIDFETTHTLDTLHKEVFEAADSVNGQYVKDQWGIESLSHHFLPLLRYRRQKLRQKYGRFPAETSKAPGDISAW
jgi:hypothetical protein